MKHQNIYILIFHVSICDHHIYKINIRNDAIDPNGHLNLSCARNKTDLIESVQKIAVEQS